MHRACRNKQTAGRGIHQMTLWGLLEAVCFGMPIGASLASASVAKAGTGRYALAISVGVVVGTSLAWGMEAAGRKAGVCIRQRSESVQERHFRALYFAAILWILFAGFIGLWLSSLSLRLITRAAITS